MSGKKPKKKGIARTNAAQQRSTESSDCKKKAIKRRDKGATSKELPKDKVIKRRDKGAQSKSESKPAGLSRVDKNATSNTEAVQKKVKRHDKNKTKPQQEEKVVKRTNICQQTSSEEASGTGGISRKDKNVQGKIENVKSTRAGTKDRNIQCKEEVKAKGVSRSAKMNQSSDSLGLNKEKQPMKKMNTGQSSAFSQSSGEQPKKKAVARSGKMNQSSESLGLESSKKTQAKKPTGASNAQTRSADIFGSAGASKPKPKPKQIGHMESSFTFG